MDAAERERLNKFMRWFCDYQKNNKDWDDIKFIYILADYQVYLEGKS